MDITKIRDFIIQTHVSDHIAGMEQDQDRATAYAQYIGECVNAAEEDYAKYKEAKLAELLSLEEETETIRKAKLESWTSEKKRNLQDLKLMYSNLRSIRMTLAQAIKTRRIEPH